MKKIIRVFQLATCLTFVAVATASAYPAAPSLSESTRITSGPAAQSLYLAVDFWGEPPCYRHVEAKAYWTSNTALHGQAGRAKIRTCEMWFNRSVFSIDGYFGQIQFCKAAFHMIPHLWGLGNDVEYSSIMNPLAVLSPNTSIAACTSTFTPVNAPVQTGVRMLDIPRVLNLSFPTD